jgi:putative oxidoreductase
MDQLYRLRAWLDSHRDTAYPLIRTFVGIALFVRGWVFVADSSALMELVAASGRDWFLPMALVHYVAPAHILGGLMLALGMLTRIAALVQIPILLGALFFIHLQEGLFAPGQSLELSALVLFLLVVFALFGSGKYSLDYFFFAREDASEPDAVTREPRQEARPSATAGTAV